MSHAKDTGLGHWIRLRMSAIALVPLVFWVVYSVLELKSATYESFTLWMQNPYNAGLMIIFILVSFYHAGLGTQEIIEDYVSCEKSKNASILLVKLALAVLAIVSVVSIAKVAF